MKWYFTWHRPNMKALGGAFWPVMAIRYVHKNGDPVTPGQLKETIKHEEVHMIDQLMLLLVLFYILYGLFWIIYGYQNNPFEAWASAIAHGTKWRPYGWINYL